MPIIAAAFGRLCVETKQPYLRAARYPAAAFGRLCVETTTDDRDEFSESAAAFGRLCVETSFLVCDFDH